MLVRFDNIDGVAIHYAREPVAPYGTIGKGPRKVQLEHIFLQNLTQALTELWGRCPWGKAEILVSGGCYVEKAGRHGEGRAIDIDALWWGMRTGGGQHLVTRDAVSYPIRYLAVEAILRKHIGMVLDFWYNHAHEDHFHCDNGTPVGFRPGSHSQTVFIQAALKHVYGQQIEIDGVAGSETKNAMIKAGVYPVSTQWMSFLDQVATDAFLKW